MNGAGTIIRVEDQELTNKLRITHHFWWNDNPDQYCIVGRSLAKYWRSSLSSGWNLAECTLRASPSLVVAIPRGDTQYHSTVNYSWVFCITRLNSCFLASHWWSYPPWSYSPFTAASAAFPAYSTSYPPLWALIVTKQIKSNKNIFNHHQPSSNTINHRQPPTTDEQLLMKHKVGPQPFKIYTLIYLPNSAGVIPRELGVELGPSQSDCWGLITKNIPQYRRSSCSWTTSRFTIAGGPSLW